MSYMITHIDDGGDFEQLCGTAEEALPIVLGLINRKAAGILVASYESGQEAAKTLRILVEHRRASETRAEIA